MPRTGGPRVPEKLPAMMKGTVPPKPLGERAGAVVSQEGSAEYADGMEALGPGPLAFERSPEAGYSYCLRAIATYETLSFGPGGEVRRSYSRSIQHGTGFGFRGPKGEYLVATNHHVAEMPEVTDAEHVLEGVPAGSRRVRELVKIVRNEEDEDTAAHIDLARIAAEPSLDLAVLQAPRPIRVMPYRLGRSASLKVGNVVVARGFPLGVFAASNVGRVTNTRQEDGDGAWEHVDFVTDAALNSGNSGSPVFAISSKTREYELVGIFHAHYKNGQGMGVVVAVDDLREMLETGRSSRRREAPRDPESEGAALLASVGREIYFPFGGLVARATPLEGGARFEIFEDFPASEAVQVALVSRAGAASSQPSEKLERELWSSLGTSLRLRIAQSSSDGSLHARKEIASLRKRLTGRTTDQRDLLSTVDFEREVVRGSSERGAEMQPATGKGLPE